MLKRNKFHQNIYVSSRYRILYSIITELPVLFPNANVVYILLLSLCSLCVYALDTILKESMYLQTDILIKGTVCVI